MPRLNTFVLALAALGARRGGAGLGVFVGLAAGALAGAAPWLGPLLMALGPARFVREALLVGAGVATVYGFAPPPGLWLGSAVGLCASIRALASRRIAVGAGVVAMVLVGVTAALDASHPAIAARLATEAAMFAATALAGWGAVRRLGGAAPSALVAPTALAITGMVQLFPRPDGLHLLSVGPLALPLGMHLWGRTARALPPSWHRAAIAICLGICGLRSFPTVSLAAAALRGELRAVPLGAETLWATPEGAPRLMAAATAVAAVRGDAASAGGVLSFPGCAAIPFFADRRPAGPHDYFFPGRPTRAEVAALVDVWSGSPPPIVVTCTAAGTELAQAWTAYPEMTRFIAARYRPVVTGSPFGVSEVVR